MGTLIARLTSRRAILAIGVVALLLFAGVARAAPLSRWFSPQSGGTDQAGSSGTPGARGRAGDASPLAGQAAATASPGGTPAARRPAPQTPAGPATPRNTPMPTSTPIPPSAALRPAATGLLTQLQAYRTAVRQHDMNTALRLQRELFAGADQAEAALKGDRSREAEAVRGAIASIRAGIAGDANQLDAAERALTGVVGGQPVGAVTKAPTPQPAPDINRLREDVAKYREALSSRDVERAVQLQGTLLSNLTAIEQSVRDDNSDWGRAFRAALADLRKGLEGDTGRLTAAAAALDRLAGQPDQAAADIPGLAVALATQIDAFRLARSANSRDELLRLQQDILDAADQAEAALQREDSPEAKAMHDAITDLRAGVAGDFARLDRARQKLGQLAGEQAPAAGTQADVIDDPARYAAHLTDLVLAYQQAIRQRDTAGMLRLQSEIRTETARGEGALKEARSPSMQELRDALGALRSALAGDLSKLDDALVHLRAVSGNATPSGDQAAAQSTTTPTPQPTPQPTTTPTAQTTARSTPQPTARSTTTQTPPAQPPAALQPVAEGLRGKLEGLRQAVRDRRPADEIAQQRADLRAEATKGEEALRDATGPQADGLRRALSVAKDAAGGDDAKIEIALQRLDEALRAP